MSNPTPAALAALDLDAIKARRDAVMKLTFDLAADGDRAFRMSIPAQQDDADMLLMKLCADVDALLAAARQGEETEVRAKSYLAGFLDGAARGNRMGYEQLRAEGEGCAARYADHFRAASQPQEGSRG